jgi:DNA-binding SARP family transcriptional activator
METPMPLGRIRLFGRFEATVDGGDASWLQARKVQELLTYLLLERNKPVQREKLADKLWPSVDASHSKKYLRQALWQLQKAGEALDPPPSRRLLVVDQEWIGVNPNANILVDVVEFEQTYEISVHAPRQCLSTELRARFERAIALYRGDLLDGWYHDWCLTHQELYRSMYLVMLDKLMVDAELLHNFEVGLGYGRKALEQDRANERTHVRMMQLHHQAGDRTAALRQFELCQQTLEADLGVAPDPDTVRVYHAIRDQGRSVGLAGTTSGSPWSTEKRRRDRNPVPMGMVTRSASDGLRRQPPGPPNNGTRGQLATAQQGPGKREYEGPSLFRLRELSNSLCRLQQEVNGYIEALENR